MKALAHATAVNSTFPVLGEATISYLVARNELNAMQGLYRLSLVAIADFAAAAPR